MQNWFILIEQFFGKIALIVVGIAIVMAFAALQI